MGLIRDKEDKSNNNSDDNIVDEKRLLFETLLMIGTKLERIEQKLDKLLQEKN